MFILGIHLGGIQGWFFQWAFCTAGATIVSGAVAERVKSPTYAAFAFFMTSFIYPVIVAWTWGGGWLSKIFDVGYMDFAGSRCKRARTFSRPSIEQFFNHKQFKRVYGLHGRSISGINLNWSLRSN